MMERAELVNESNSNGADTSLNQITPLASAANVPRSPQCLVGNGGNAWKFAPSCPGDAQCNPMVELVSSFPN